MNAQTINNDNFVSVVPRILDPGMKFTKESLQTETNESTSETKSPPTEVKKINFFTEHKQAITIVLIVIVVILLLFLAYKYFYEKKETTTDVTTTPKDDIVSSKETELKKAKDEYLSTFIIDENEDEQSGSSETPVLDEILFKTDEVSIKNDTAVIDAILNKNEDAFAKNEFTKSSDVLVNIISVTTKTEDVSNKLPAENIEVLLSKYKNNDDDEILSIGEYNKREPESLVSKNEANKISLDEMKQVDDAIFIKSKEEESQKTDSTSSGEIVDGGEKSDEENYDNLHSDNSDDDIDCFKRFTKK